MTKKLKIVEAPANSNQFKCDPKKLAAQIAGLADDQHAISQATGSLRSHLKAILDQEGYHSNAMATIRKIHGMNKTQRADFMRTFQPMFEAMNAAFWSKDMEDLLDGEPEKTVDTTKATGKKAAGK